MKSCVIIGDLSVAQLLRLSDHVVSLGYAMRVLDNSSTCNALLEQHFIPYEPVKSCDDIVKAIKKGDFNIVVASVSCNMDDSNNKVVSCLRALACRYEQNAVFEACDLDKICSLTRTYESSAYERKLLASKIFKRLSDIDAQIASTLNTLGDTVMIIGSGGREHAIAVKIALSAKVDTVLVAPGNGGTSNAGGKVSNVDNLDVSDNEAVVSFAKSNGVAFVIVGPEQPLVNGLSDALGAAGIACFGPSARAAKIEASKAWSKDFFSRHSIRTARYRNFTDFAEAKVYIESQDYRMVIKASGIAAGKGVVIPSSTKEAVEAARQIMLDRTFGSAGDEVVVEEFLEGEELSLLAFCDGERVSLMPAAQDHKRALDGDEGPNTGGMGAYAPAPLATPELLAQCAAVLRATVRGMALEGAPYKGVLYAGFMITKEGPSVLEYNCRFGDPETQVLLPLLESDLYVIMRECVSGTLDPCAVRWVDGYACTVVCAAPGYPGAYPVGSPVSGLDEATGVAGVTVYHAGTRGGSNPREVVTSGGRVLAVTGTAKTLRGAVQGAYKGVGRVRFEGMHFRKDIAQRGLRAPLRIGVIGSTRGTDMQAIIDAIEAGKLNAKISVVVSNKKEAVILKRAEAHGIATKFIGAAGKDSEAYDDLVTAQLEQHGVQLVLMIGYMRIVSPAFAAHWANRCMNVHPSLLPDFAGGMDLQVHADVIAAGRSKSGCTVHFVTAEVDGGPVLVVKECSVEPDETPESLKAKVQALEGEAFLEAIKLFQARLSGVITYASAGVDIDAGEALVEAIKPMCKATRRAGCDAELGGFGGLFDLSQAGYDSSETVLVSGTDGVGTKLKIAQAVGKHDTIGIDLVAMCVNDILVCGAEPLFFLDYYATGALNVGEAAQVVKGIAEGCVQSRCALIGGETAEMAGMYDVGEYDLAGFSVGAVRRKDILPQGVGAGDMLIGLRSSGVHSNGYSLVRKCVEKSGLSWSDPAPFSPGESVGSALLAPTKIYVKALMPLVKQGLLKGMAHITGGGLLDNLPRVMPADTVAFIDIEKSGWVLPPVFQWLQSLANLPLHELLRTFNCGVGMVLVIDPSSLAAVIDELEAGGEQPMILGYLQKRDETRGADQPQVLVSGSL